VDKLSKGPEPKWFVLKILNVVVLSTFVGSIVYVSWYYRDAAAQSDDNKSPLTNMFLPIMIFWSLCMAYFFGFFGISFVDTESLTESPAEYGLDDIQRQMKSQQQQKQQQEKQVKKLEPRNDTVICSDSVPEKLAATAAESACSTNDFTSMSNDEVLHLLNTGAIKDYQLEKKLGDCTRAVEVRRLLYSQLLEDNSPSSNHSPLELIPYAGYDYGKVFGANCEIVIGYVPLPLGVVGPLLLNQEPFYIPMATTEGCLVASTNRGCKALTASGGVSAVVLKDAITRAPCVRLPSAMRAAAVKLWIAQPENFQVLEAAFNSTTNYGRLAGIDATVAGRNVYLRFACMSGDAMGMNMVSKGCLKAIEVLEQEFPDLVLIAISGNMCTDKKPAAINWILGRGKSIVVEAIVPQSVVHSVLKSNVNDMIETNRQKNLIGSAMAGSVGGFNAHAANIVTAVYLATGQDPAQNVESSNCLTLMELADDGKSLHVSVTMPSVEVGTVGGGTHLPAQAACLEMLGVRGAAKGEGSMPGDNARKLAQVVGGAVLAGELSLIAALAANHLVQSHMVHNRKPNVSHSVSQGHLPSAK